MGTNGCAWMPIGAHERFPMGKLMGSHGLSCATSRGLPSAPVSTSMGWLPWASVGMDMGAMGGPWVPWEPMRAHESQTQYCNSLAQIWPLCDCDQRCYSILCCCDSHTARAEAKPDMRTMISERFRKQFVGKMGGLLSGELPQTCGNWVWLPWAPNGHPCPWLQAPRL